MTIQCMAKMEFLMWCHCSLSPFERLDAPYYVGVVPELLSAGVIALTKKQKVYELTPLGKAWIEAVCNVPLPTHGFFDEMGRKL